MAASCSGSGSAAARANQPGAAPRGAGSVARGAAAEGVEADDLRRGLGLGRG
ncbi:hypothetical protein HMPREF0731_0991, partial [Pseudoroseomonas cervicalis ATCC 49957]